MPTNAEYAKINIACKELGLDKYQLLNDRYGLESSKQLTRFQTGDMLSYFKKLGWKIKRSSKGGFRGHDPNSPHHSGSCPRNPALSPSYDDPMMRKVVAIWITLYQAKVIRNKSDRALQKYVKRMTGKDNLRWCNSYELNSLIEGLKSWGTRELPGT